MTPSFGVVLDSACDFPSDWPYRDRVHIIPLHIIFDDEDLLDGVDISRETFFQHVEAVGKIPKTSQPSPGEFARFYRQLAPRYQTLISIHLGSRLSGTFQSAVLGAQLVADDITVLPFDSYSGSAGAAFLAEEAIEMIDDGATLEAIIQRLALVRERIQIFLTPRDLRYARMSGRVNAIDAFIASALRITPIVILTAGELVASERARSRKQAIAKMVQMMKERLGDGPVKIAIVHAQSPEDAELFRQTILSTFQPQELWIAGLSNGVSAHLGPGTIGIVGYRTD